MRKYLNSIIITLFFLIILAPNAFAATYNQSTNIYDSAGLFSMEAKTKANNSINNLETKYGYDIIVITDNAQVPDAEQYANHVYDTNDIGFGNNKNGLLLYINMYTREVVFVINEPETRPYYYNDKRKNNILDGIQPMLKNTEYDEALDFFVTKNTSYLSKELTIVRENISILNFIISAAISAIYMYILIKKHKPVKIATTAKEYIEDNSFKLERKTDNFLRSHTYKTAKSKSGSSGGGSRGGGRRSGSRSF